MFKYAFISSSLKPTAISESIFCNFLSETEQSLVVVKSEWLEVYSTSASSLALVLEIPINSQVSCIAKLPHQAGKNSLLILTESRNLFTLTYNESPKITSETSFSLIKKTQESAAKLAISSCNKIGLAYFQQSYLNIFTLENNKIIDSYDIGAHGDRLEDMKFLKDSTSIAFLYKVKEDRYKLKIGEMVASERRLIEKKCFEIEGKPSNLLSISQDTCCVFTCKKVIKFNLTGNVITKFDTDWENIVAASDAGNGNWIVSDNLNLYLAYLETGFESQRLGKFSSVNSICNMSNKKFFISSKTNDSKYIQISDDLIEDSYIQVLQFIPNIAPIIDFKINEEVNFRVLNMIACCGCDESGGIRLISKGVTVNIELEQEIANIQGIWTLKSKTGFDSHMFLSFSSSTQIFEISSYNITRCDYPGTESFSQSSLLIFQKADYIVQVTSSGIYVYLDNFTIVHSIEGLLISSVTYNKESTLAVALASQVLIVYSICLPYITEQSRFELASDVSCLHCYSKYLVISSWEECDLVLRDSTTMELVFKEPEKLSAPVKSVKFIDLGSKVYMIVGLRDGFLLFYTVRANQVFCKESSFKIGYQAILLEEIKTLNSFYVFAACDRPVILYYENEQFHLTNTNIKEVSYFSSFHTESLPFSLALSVRNKFFIVSMPELQEYSFQNYVKKYTIRRLALFNDKIIALALPKQGPASVRLFDSDKQEIDKLELLANETPNCVQIFNSMALVGISVSGWKSEHRVHTGRIILVNLVEDRLVLKKSYEFGQQVYNFVIFDCYLFTGFDLEIRIFNLSNQSLEDLEISKKIKVGLLLDVSQSTLAAASMLKGVDLYSFKPEVPSLDLTHKNYKISCATALKLISNEVIIVAESIGVISVLKANHASNILDVVSYFSIGMEVINSFKMNSFTTRNGKDVNVIFVTTKGRIGAIFNLDEQKFKVLKELEALVVGENLGKSFVMDRVESNSGPICFVKGDVVEMFLEYSPEKRMCLALEVSRKIDRSVNAGDVHDILLDMIKLP